MRRSKTWSDRTGPTSIHGASGRRRAPRTRRCAAPATTCTSMHGYWRWSPNSTRPCSGSAGRGTPTSPRRSIRARASAARSARDQLRLPGGRTPHGFLRTDRGRRRVAVEQFAAIDPDATIELRVRDGSRLEVFDLFVELDRTFRPAKNIDKFKRYDHMISGWCALKDRYTTHCTAPPLVVFVCRDQANAKEFCRAADPVVSAAHAYGGEYPSEWRYPGRDGMFFVAERDVHDGRLLGYALPTLPPERRAAVVDDRSARSCHPRQRPLLPVAATVVAKRRRSRSHAGAGASDQLRGAVLSHRSRHALTASRGSRCSSGAGESRLIRRLA